MKTPHDPADLDAILGIGTPNPPASPQDEIDRLAEHLLSLRPQLEHIKGQIELIEDAIAVRTPEEPGDAIVDGEQYSFLVSRSEQWKWDQDKLQAKLPAQPVPDFIKVSYAVNKKKFQALSPAEQQDFLDALTRKPGTPKISVGPKT